MAPWPVCTGWLPGSGGRRERGAANPRPARVKPGGGYWGAAVRGKMKIRELTPENYPKVAGLLRQVFPRSNHEARLVENLHRNGRVVHEWVGIHISRVIAYIVFSQAYNGAEVCGLHLALWAVKPEFQGQGVGAELLRFALRQEVIKTSTIFVLGNPDFYRQFGFAVCEKPVCPLAQKKTQFLCLRDNSSSPFTVGYEPEFGP